MSKFLIAAALTLAAGSAFAQEAPFSIQNGEVAYPGQSMTTGSMFEGSASASTQSDFMFEGGNVNWDQNYSGK